MGAESTCLFRPLKNYLFGLLVLFFYFFRQAWVRINHILTQQTRFFFFKDYKVRHQNTQIISNDPSLPSPDKTLTSCLATTANSSN